MLLKFGLVDGAGQTLKEPAIEVRVLDKAKGRTVKTSPSMDLDRLIDEALEYYDLTGAEGEEGKGAAEGGGKGAQGEGGNAEKGGKGPKGEGEEVPEPEQQRERQFKSGGGNGEAQGQVTEKVAAATGLSPKMKVTNAVLSNRMGKRGAPGLKEKGREVREAESQEEDRDKLSEEVENKKNEADTAEKVDDRDDHVEEGGLMESEEEEEEDGAVEEVIDRAGGKMVLKEVNPKLMLEGQGGEEPSWSPEEKGKAVTTFNSEQGRSSMGERALSVLDRDDSEEEEGDAKSVENLEERKPTSQGRIPPTMSKMLVQERQSRKTEERRSTKFLLGQMREKSITMGDRQGRITTAKGAKGE